MYTHNPPEVEVSETNDAERRERVEVVREPGVERREHYVEHVGAARRSQVARLVQFIWLATGILEGLIALRVVLKLIAANPDSPFARLVYRLTAVFLWPFAGLTATPAAGGSVLELSSIIAMIVYALLAWVLIKLVQLLLMPSNSRSVSVYRREES